MRPIPRETLTQVLDDEFFRHCCVPGCYLFPEIHHAIIVAGRQIDDKWNLVPACHRCHQESHEWHEFFRAVAFARATPEDLEKYPKSGFFQERRYLLDRYREQLAAIGLIDP